MVFQYIHFLNKISIEIHFQMKFIQINLMKFSILFLNKTALNVAVLYQNIDIVKFLLSNDKINANLRSVTIVVSFIKFFWQFFL